MKKTFFARHATLILFLVCFFTPFILRGARDAVRNIKNDVKDWLPNRFSETREMEWFWRHFSGERFIIATWDGCTGGPEDEAFHLFKKKLAPSIPPSKQDEVFPPPASKDVGATWLERRYNFIADRLGLYVTENDHFNWGGLEEKWLRGFEDKWYFITPDGMLHEFLGSDAPVPVLCRMIMHRLGFNQLKSHPLVSFGPVDGPWYYNDPTRLQAQLFRSVTTGPDVLHSLTSGDGVLKGNEVEAMKRLKGQLYGPDGKQTALIITMSDAGLRDFHRVLSRGVLGKELGALYRIAEECGIAMDDLHLGGPPVDNVAIDEEGTITLVRLVSFCVILGVGLSYACFRSLLATGAVFLTGGVSAALGLAFVGWAPNVTADAIMMSMPALVYVLGISGAVHFVNYYREAVDEFGEVGAPERAMSHAWKPAILCNITTSLGLMSLYTSEIVPIRKFGLFSALGVMGTVVMLFTFLPAALQMFPLRLPKHVKREDGAESALDAYLSNYWTRFARTIIRYHWGVAIGCTLLIAGVGYGVRYINTSVNLLDLFDRNAKLLKDYAWIENHLGMLVPMEVVIKFSPPTMRPLDDPAEGARAPSQEDRYRLNFLERMETVSAVQREIDDHFGDQGSQVVGRTISAVTFSPNLPKPTDTYALRSANNAGLEQNRGEFLRSDYLAIDQKDQSELWRISLRVAAFKGVDYGEFVRDLRNIVEPLMAAQNARQTILRDIVAERAADPTSSERPKYFRVALVLPDEVKEAVDAAIQKARNKPSNSSADNTAPASEGEGKVAAAGDAAATAVVAAAGENPPAAPEAAVDEIIHQAVFVRNLYAALQTTGARVGVIAAGKVDEKVAQQLADFERIVVFDRPPAALAGLVAEHPQVLVQGNEFLSSSALATAPRESDAPPIAAVYTGVVPIVYKAQRTLLDSLIDSTAWSFLTITPLMMLVSRSILAGGVAMLPNALPVLLIFGAMGWLGIRVDIGSMMTASIALGVAVDDTIHFLTWFKEELHRLGDRNEAIVAAYQRCATPTFQAALISGLGLSIFALSTFTPTQRFGVLMLTILFAGVVAELVFFPALLASPLGAVFRVAPSKDDSDDRDGDQAEREGGLPPTLPLDGKAGRKAGAKRIAFMALLSDWLLACFGRKC